MAQQSQGIISYWSTTTASATAAANVIGEVIGFSGPGMSANVIDVTNLVSTAKEKLVGVYDGGNVTLNVNMLVTDGGQTLMRESLVARTKGKLLIQLAYPATVQKIGVKGFVSGMNFTGSVDNKLAGDITIAISGGVSVAVA